MKLSCSVTILNRLLPNLNINSSQKYKNAALAIMKTPKDETIYLLLITNKNKNGVKYKIKGNIEKTFVQFKHEGKSTIRFKQPPHDLCITADKIQLNNFMLFINKVWKNEARDVPEIEKLTFSQIKCQSTNKLEIKTKSQYPVLQGFPSNLQILNISKCQLKRLDNRILKLKHLTVLCLDNNHLTDVPVDLKKLSLKHLSLSYNKLGKNIQSWNFLSWPLSESLEYLNLSNNEMRYFPASLVRFKKLKILKLSNISANRIPFRLCLLPNLLELDLSKNKILGLPGTITKRMRKLDKLDVADNPINVSENRDCKVISDNLYVPSLLELTIRSTVEHRLSYSEATIPLNVIPLLDHVKFCLCGKPCVKDFGTVFGAYETKLLANTFISSSHSYMVSIVHQACCPSHFNFTKTE